MPRPSGSRRASSYILNNYTPKIFFLLDKFGLYYDKLYVIIKYLWGMVELHLVPPDAILNINPINDGTIVWAETSYTLFPCRKSLSEW